MNAKALLLLVPVIASAPLLRRWHLRWGATEAEATKSLPGDDIVPEATASTRAITIKAPPAEVWPWLAQMGQDKAGFYSYDLLERLTGAGIHNADRIVPEWQDVVRGDLMRTYRYVQRFEPLGWPVEVVEPGHALVVRNLKHTWSWALVLEPTGEGKTRLIARTRASRKGFPGLLTEVWLAEPAHFLMEVGVLRGVKHRAERSVRAATLIDGIVSEGEFSDVISVTVNAEPAAIFDAMYGVTVDDMPIAKAIGTLRYLPGRLLGRRDMESTAGEPFMESLLKNGTVVLAEDPGREVVVGGAGKYHQLLDQEPRPFTNTEEFRAFSDPDYQKLVMSLRVEPTGTLGLSRLVLEHRTRPLSEASRRRFRRYWRVIKPTGAFVTRQLLWAAKRRAEAARPSPSRVA
jgi:hypothetical protein